MKKIIAVIAGFISVVLAHASLNENATLTPSTPAGQVLIFISASMPQDSVVQWVEQANTTHAEVIIQGLVGDTLLDTKHWMQQVVNQTTNKQGGVQINPLLFKQYAITAVPAVVVVPPSAVCLPTMSCGVLRADRVWGNVSLATALQKIVSRSDAASATAQRALLRLGALHAQP